MPIVRYLDLKGSVQIEYEYYHIQDRSNPPVSSIPLL
jgi:hypothetical protein